MERLSIGIAYATGNISKLRIFPRVNSEFKEIIIPDGLVLNILSLPNPEFTEIRYKPSSDFPFDYPEQVVTLVHGSSPEYYFVGHLYDNLFPVK